MQTGEEEGGEDDPPDWVRQGGPTALLQPWLSQDGGSGPVPGGAQDCSGGETCGGLQGLPSQSVQASHQDGAQAGANTGRFTIMISYQGQSMTL